MAITPPQTPKLVIQPAPTHSRLTVIKRWLLCIVVVSMVSVYLGYQWGQGQEKKWQKRFQSLQNEYQQQQKQWRQTRSQLVLVKTEHEVQQVAMQELQALLRKQAAALETRKQELDFYQRLLSPEVSGKGLRVFEARAQPLSENRWRLSVILVQRIERARQAEGDLDIFVQGRKNGQAVTVPVKLMVDQGGNSTIFRHFKFKYFLPVGGVLTLPAGLQPEEILFRLKPRGKRAKIVENRFDWQTITAQQSQAADASQAPLLQKEMLH